MCEESVCKPLDIICKTCLESGYFPSQWKKAKVVVPVHEKGEKETIKNYPPVSLLLICAEIFQRIIFNNMIKYFAENNLISPNLSGFRPGDSITQLLSINLEILR